MGVSGTLEYLAELISSAKPKKKKQMNTVAIKIRMDCEGCAHKVKKALEGVKGAKKVEVDLKQQKATVSGFVEAKKVLKAAQATKKKVEPWPYVPHTMIAHPNAPGVYDKKAPPNLVRKTDAPGVATLNPYAPGVYDKKAPPNLVRKTDAPGVATLNPVEEQYTLMFNDENVNACSVM